MSKRRPAPAKILKPHPHAARLDRLERLAYGMDSRFRVPGTSIRFGWDSILGLVPGLGDVASLAPASYIWLEGHRMGASNEVKGRMAVNIAVDWVVGSIPIVGDLLDVGLKANRRNVRLLREHFGVPSAAPGEAEPPRGAAG